MIRARIHHILKNYKKKLTIYDYIRKPEITIKQEDIFDAKYEARPVFNSIRVGKNKKNDTQKNGYCKYKRLKKRKTE